MRVDFVFPYSIRTGVFLRRAETVLTDYYPGGKRKSRRPRYDREPNCDVFSFLGGRCGPTSLLSRRETVRRGCDVTTRTIRDVLIYEGIGFVGDPFLNSGYEGRRAGTSGRTFESFDVPSPLLPSPDQVAPYVGGIVCYVP